MNMVTQNPRRMGRIQGYAPKAWVKAMFWVGFGVLFVGSATAVTLLIHPLAVPALFYLGWKLR